MNAQSNVTVNYFTTDGKTFPSFKEAAEYARAHPGISFCRHEGGRAFAKAPKASTTAEVTELKVAVEKLNAVVDAQQSEIELLKTQLLNLQKRRSTRKAA
jgi:hypothetical protein